MAASTLLILSCGRLIEHSRAFAIDRACTSEKAWITGVRQHSKGYRVEVLSDVRDVPAEALVSRLNSGSARNQFLGDHVMIVGARLATSSELVPYVLIALFDHGCLVQWSRADPRLIARLLSGELT